MRVQNTTDSTSSSTGALVCSGGAAINKVIYAGSNISLSSSAGSIRFSNTTAPKRIVLWNNAADDTTRFFGFGLDSYTLRIQTSSTDDRVSFRCGTGQDTDQELMRIEGDKSTKGVTVLHTTESSSSSTGALVVSGGVGVAKNAYIGGGLHLGGGTATIPAKTDSGIWLEGVGSGAISGRIYIGDGSGWSFKVSKKTGGTTTDLFSFRDDGSLTISGNLTTGSTYSTDFSIFWNCVDGGWEDQQPWFPLFSGRMRREGKMATLQSKPWPYGHTVKTTATALAMSTLLPTQFRPLDQAVFPVMYDLNFAVAIGCIDVLTSGEVRFYPLPHAPNLASGVDFRLNGFSLTYACE